MTEDRYSEIERSSRGKDSIVLAAQAGLVGAAIVLLGMIAAYFENLEEFTFSPLQLLPYVGGVWIAVAAGLLGVASVLARWLPSARYWFLPFVAVTAWAQGAFNVPDYGPLDGSALDWPRAQYLWDILLLSCIGVGFYLMRAQLTRPAHAFLVLGCVVAVQLTYALTTVSLGNTPRAATPDPEIHRLSKGENVFLIILDAFQSDAFKEIVTRSREYREALEGFVYWPDTVAFHPTTYPTVPALFLGEAYRNETTYDEFRRRVYTEDSVLWHFRDADYQVDLIPLAALWPTSAGRELTDNFARTVHVALSWRVALSEALNLFEFSLFRSSFQPFRQLLYQDGAWSISRYAFAGYPDVPTTHQLHRTDVMMLEQIESRAYVDGSRPLFRFIHLFTPHLPIVFNAEMELERRSFNRDTFVDQAEAALRMLLGFLELLKEKGVYDNSRIVVVADHGRSGIGVRNDLSEALAVEDPLPQDSEKGELMAQATPLFLTKDVDAEGPLTIRHEPVHLEDVAPSLADGIVPVNRFPGYSVFSETIPAERVRTFLHYEWADHGWGSDYLDPITEYRIEGHAWLPSSWSEALRWHRKDGRQELVNALEEPN